MAGYNEQEAWEEYQARKGNVNPQQFSPNNVSRSGPVQPPMDPNQRREAMEFLQRMMGAQGGGGYTPILKALKRIGVEPFQMELGLPGDTPGELREPVDCLVIPMDELITKEWRFMSEIEQAQGNMQ